MSAHEHERLTKEQKLRYKRQVILPEIGLAGQQRLGRASVMIAGLGGLGSITSYYLAAAGVGRLRIIDSDHVALDNLNRQLLHSTADVQRLKVSSAEDKLRRLNPGCCIEPVYERIEEENGIDLAEGCDLIIDGTDNLPTRHVLNRVSVRKRIPFIYGGINGWNGTAATFIPGKTGCFACLFQGVEKKRVEGRTPALGPTAGVIASIQTLEALRIMLGLEPGLAGRFLVFQGGKARFRTVPLEKNPDCALCGRST